MHIPTESEPSAPAPGRIYRKPGEPFTAHPVYRISDLQVDNWGTVFLPLGVEPVRWDLAETYFRKHGIR